jgi:hypothetical protein
MSLLRHKKMISDTIRRIASMAAGAGASSGKLFEPHAAKAFTSVEFCDPGVTVNVTLHTVTV